MKLILLKKSSWVVLFWLPALLLSAQNGFKIGMMSSYNRYTTHTNYNSLSDHIVTSVINPATNKYSSILGILKDDGFNLIEDYIPDTWITYQQYRDYAMLVQNHGMQLIDNYQSWYKPDIQDNQYDNLCNSPTTPNVDYDQLYYQVYAVTPGAFYAHSMGAEKYCDHDYPYANTCPSTNPPSSQWLTAQVKPKASSDAAGHFKNMRNNYDPGAKIIMAEAAHGGMIFDNYVNPYAVPGHTILPQYYINWNIQNTVPTPINGDIFVEASYMSDAFKKWDVQNDPLGPNANAISNSWCYLGKFGTMDYARTNGYTKILGENDISMTWDPTGAQYKYHSNPSAPNANLLKFYAYTSFIHKSHGIVFYNYPEIYDLITPGADIQNQATATNMTTLNRFGRTYAPQMYNKYVSKFARELRYLVNNNYLSDDDTKVMYEKTQHSADLNYILPACTAYLPAIISYTDARDFISANNLPVNGNITNTQRDEFHSLRYIIRTNGTEAVMIISNPNPYSVHNVNLNFNNLPNNAYKTHITNAKFVDVLFEDGSITDVNSMQYRTDSVSSVIPVTFALNKAYTMPFCTKTINAEFGPFDTHIYHFRTSNIPLARYNNGWSQLWTNNGNGIIGTWGTQIFTGDKFIPFDFNGDGDEELLCVQNLNSNAFCSIIEYNSSAGVWMSPAMWTNNGSGSIENSSFWTIKTGDRFIPIDADGDGKKNELLCIQAQQPLAKAVILKRNSQNQFYVYWTNSGTGYLSNNSTQGWSILFDDRFKVGDFNGDGKMNDLMCIESSGPWWGIVSFDVPTNNFSWYWTQGTGNLTGSSVWQMNATDEYYIEDYNGDGVVNDLMCVNRPTGKISILYATAGSFVWQQRWSNAGNGFIAGENWPFNNNVSFLTGDIDASDNKAELMFIQRYQTSSKAMTVDLDASNTPVKNWNIGDYANGPWQNFIDSWRVNDPYSTDIRYIFIKPSIGKKCLLAFKNYGCNNSLISMFAINNTSLNYRDTVEVVTDAGRSAVLLLEKKVKICPVPNNGIFSLRAEEPIAHPLVEIFDILGKSVYKKQFTTLLHEEINMAYVSNGVYYIYITNSQGFLEVQKIIKE